MIPRGPHDQQPNEPGWWQASDGKWYPPESAPGAAAAPQVANTQTAAMPTAMPPQRSAGWFDTTWFFVVSLLFCFPLALVLLWRKPWSRGVKIGATVAIAVVAIGVGAASASSNNNKTTSTVPRVPATAAAPTAAPQPTRPQPTEPTTTPKPTAPPTTQAPKPTAPPAPVETASQANARRSAEQYLSLGNGFSRAGLIAQLSSSAGEGYSLADATYGVDATHTDWNAQACLSAKNYLKLQPFSHAGLVEQLSSSAGDQYTLAQAEYGVTCAGL